MTSTEREKKDVQPWEYEPAADRNRPLVELLKDFPREPHLWMYAIRTAAALMIRSWLKVYHRFEVRDRERLPIGRSFIIVANHQSHYDTPCLVSTIPLRNIHRAFPAAAADYFFKDLPSSAFASIVVNGLPFKRQARGADSLVLCRELLRNEGNILIIFPEGTRTKDGAPGTFKPGIGLLCAGTDIPVVPCYLEGAFHALPKGAQFPRPTKMVLHVGEPRSYPGLDPKKESFQHIASDLEHAVFNLRPGS
jgi:1-acyl-sn-glycerol-3-phosphate acyltransferase